MRGCSSPAPRVSYRLPNRPTPSPPPVREALRAKEEGASKTILFNLSGHGMIDLYAYEQYFADKLQDYTVTDAELRRTIDQLERIIK